MMMMREHILITDVILYNHYMQREWEVVMQEREVYEMDKQNIIKIHVVQVQFEK